MDYDEQCRRLHGKEITIKEFIAKEEYNVYTKIFLYRKGSNIGRKIELSELVEIQDTLEPNGVLEAGYEQWEDERGWVHEGRRLEFDVRER